jgi:hypothetical protein
VAADGHEAWQERSAAIFGNRYFAEVVMAADRLSAMGDVFVTTRMVAAVTGLGDSLVRPVMRRLSAAGLIAELPRTGGPRSTLNYQVVRNPLWEAIVAACVEATAGHAAQAPGA